jgi:hypothetical protein
MGNAMFDLPSNIDDNVTVRELGQGLRNDSLAASESSWNAYGTTLNTGEQRVEDTLTNNERLVGRHLLVGRTGHSYGPLVHHAVLGLGAVEVKLQDLLINSIATLLGDAGDGTLGARRQQNLMFAEQTVLKDSTEDVTTSDVVSNLQGTRCEFPLLLAVESGQVDTTGDIDAVRVVGDTLEGTLNTVVDGFHETRTKLDGQWLSGPEYGVAYSYASYAILAKVLPRVYMRGVRTGLFVDLNGGLVGFDSNDLTDEVVVTNTDLGRLAVAI